MPAKDLYAQLKDRRVIRTAIIYVALLWAILQVGDLLADAQLMSAIAVRWVIIVGVVGFPLALFASWFFENPWRALSVRPQPAFTIMSTVPVRR